MIPSFGRTLTFAFFFAAFSFSGALAQRNATTGEILRTLTLDTTRNYQPTGAKRGGPSRPYGPYRPRKKQQPEPR